MTQVSIYDTAIELFTKAKQESESAATTVELMRLNNVSLTKKFDELDTYCDHIEFELKQAEEAIADTSSLTTRLMAVSNAVESLTDDNVELQAKLKQALNETLNVSGLNKKIAEQAVEIKSLAAYKRKTEVLARDLKLAEVKLQAARQVKPKSAKPVKAVMGAKNYRALQEENARLNQYIKELVEYGQTAPQFLGGLKHSKQGVIDCIDAKPEKMCVTDPKTGESREVMVQRIFVTNMHNSTKVVTRIINEEGLHTVKVPTGGTLKVDDEIRDHITAYLETLDNMNKKLKARK